MKCPGQDMQYWKGDAIFDVKCPECSTRVEFYKDDTTRKCPKCGHRFVNPKMDFGCATYCQFAEQCLGTLPEEFVMSQDSLLKDKVAVEVKRYFTTDFKSISRAMKIAKYAEKIGKATEGANLALILCSSYLFTIGYVEASKHTQEIGMVELQQYGPAAAREILLKVGAAEPLIHQVEAIVGGSFAELQDDVTSLHIVEDAYNLMLLENRRRDNGEEESSEVDSITDRLNTALAKEEAETLVAS